MNRNLEMRPLYFCPECKDYTDCATIMYDKDGNEVSSIPQCANCGNPDISFNEQLLFDVKFSNIEEESFVYSHDEKTLYRVMHDWDEGGATRVIPQDIEEIMDWIADYHEYITPKQRDLLISLV